MSERGAQDEPLFDAPWQAEALAMAVALQDTGLITPAEWSEALGRQRRGENLRSDGGDYYHCVVAALEELLDILGGGFIFNYRLAEIYYGFTAVVARPLASGSIIEAAFEDPVGGAPLVKRERVSPMTNRYDFRSPPVRGVKARAPYRVAIRVLDRQETQVLWTRTMTFTSNVDGTLVPEKPLTIGPGYHRNPEALADQR